MMPPTLDLAGGVTHTRMVMAPPRLNLRRAASYNHHADKGPLSSTSSRFNFNHLLLAASPPPSPRLPTLVPPRPRKLSNAPRPSRVFKVVLWTLGAVLVLYLTGSTVRRSGLIDSLATLSLYRAEERYEMVSQDMLPDFPTPVIFTDNKGNARWAVSIPPKHVAAPIPAGEYADMCDKCRSVAARVHEMRHPGSSPPAPGASDRYFVDVHEAQRLGFLPVPTGPGSAANARTVVVSEAVKIGSGGVRDTLKAGPACDSSLTFVLETDDAGIGMTLLHLWTAYALAQLQGRAFFVDDSRWAYGEYTNIFRAPPAPRCRPPRRHEMLPCPLQARHLIVASALAEDYFDASLGLQHGGVGRGKGEGVRMSAGEAAVTHPQSAAATTARQQRARQQKARFELARTGYEALFQLNDQDHEYVAERIEQLLGRTQAPVEGDGDGIVVGVHVRRGDRHPVEFQYRDSYVPVNLYAERAQRILDLTYNASASSPTKGASRGADFDAVRSGRSRSLVVVASDDPMVYEADEFSGAARAQERIKLASKAAIQQASGQQEDRSHMHKFVDDTFGWEGGFFAAMFWNLGVSAPSNAKKSAAAAATAESLRLRSLVGRAYMMDLDVLARASDVVVCTASATGCRLLAVMMGWERAVERGYWVNIDGDLDWDWGEAS